VPLDSVLPGVEELVVILLLVLDSALVLDLSKFGGTLLVHAILQVTSHGSVTLVHLTKNVCLMGLLVKSSLDLVLLSGSVLTLKLSINLELVLLLEPLGLLLQSLLEEDVLLTVLVDILEQVDAGLILTAPLLLTSVPLSLVLLLSQLLNVALILSLVRLLLLVMRLKSLGLSATLISLLLLDLLDGTLAGNGLFKTHLVSL